MRFVTWCAAALLLASASLAPAAQGPPKLLLHVPFDNDAKPAFAAAGGCSASYVHTEFEPGKKGNAAKIGSSALPCGLVLRAQGLVPKSRGSLALWYRPDWDPADPDARRRDHVLVTDERRSVGLGRFRLAVAGGSVHFAWRGRTVQSASAPIAAWKAKEWHHIIATWDSEKGIALFLDGKPAADLAVRWRLPATDILYVGADSRGLSTADGWLDELRLYDRALTAKEVELASIQNLASPNAPVSPVPAAATATGKPRLTLHLPFDGSAKAAVAKGTAEPTAAKGMEFTKGLIGKALVCGKGIDLAFPFAKNVSKQAGAITLWARTAFGATVPRGVLVADEQASAKEPTKSGHSLSLWLQRQGVPGVHFEMLPLRLSQGLYRWQNAEWYHLTVCWRRGGEMVLYINGYPVSRRAGPGTTWPMGTSKVLHIGSWGGQLPAEAVIDDLRVYDAPLSADQVLRDASRFVLPLKLQLHRTLFEHKSAIELVGDVHSESAERLAIDLSILVSDPAGREVATVTKKLKIAPNASTQVRLSLPKTATQVDGLYRVTTTCPNRISAPSAYFVVVPSLSKADPAKGDAQPKPNLKLLQTIDCEKASAAARFCSTERTRIKEANCGTYREAGPYPNDRFAYRFAIDTIGLPHLALVSFPDDARRSAEIVLNSPRFSAPRDVATGYLTPDSPSGRMLEFPIYFWPRERDNALIFRTLEPGRPAACAKITIHQVLGPLPRAGVELPPDGGRSFGLSWLDPSVPLCFGTHRLTASDIYESFSRLTNYMAFTGQNLLCYPVAWHTGFLFPSARERFRMGAGADRHCNDWMEYALHLCERRGVRFVPELFLDETYALSDANMTHTEQSVAAGVATARMVLWDGTLGDGSTQGSPRYTPVAPTVQAAILGSVDEMLARYGDSPALDGLSLHLGAGHCGWFGSLQSGYGDATIAQFEKDTGTRVPSATKGGGRFAQRARWLLTKKRGEWIAWRCRKVFELHAEMARRLQKRRPGLKLTLTIAVPDASVWLPLHGLADWSAGRRTPDQMLREAGIDLALYAKTPNIVVRKAQYPVDVRYLVYRGSAMEPPAIARDYQLLSEANAPFAACPQRGATCVYRLFESSVGRAKPMKGMWWKSPAWRATQPTPSGRTFLAPYARAVAALDALTLSSAGAALSTMGHEHDVRTFARAFRALPRRPFADVPGMADPVCARELRDGDQHFVYLVNRLGIAVDAYMAFEPRGVVVRDLVAGKQLALPVAQARKLPAAMPKGFVSEHTLPKAIGPVPGEATTQPVTGALLEVKLAPYGLRSYRVLTRGAKLVYAAAQTPMGLRVRLAQRIESARSLVTNTKAKPDVVEVARAVLAKIDRAWKKREIARVTHLLNSFPLERLR